MNLIASGLFGVVVGALIVLAIMWRAYNEMYSELTELKEEHKYAEWMQKSRR